MDTVEPVGNLVTPSGLSKEPVGRVRHVSVEMARSLISSVCRLVLSCFDDISASASVGFLGRGVCDATMLEGCLLDGRTPMLKISISGAIGEVLGETPVFASKDSIKFGMISFNVEVMSGMPYFFASWKSIFACSSSPASPSKVKVGRLPNRVMKVSSKSLLRS